MFLFFLLFNAYADASQLLPKCCQVDEEVHLNVTFQCRRDVGRRWQIFTNETQFFSRNVSGVCNDAFNDKFTYFGVKDGSKIEILNSTINTDFLSKCCPWNYAYNSVKHSCEESKQDGIFTGVFRVGLPHCSVIEDITHGHDNPPFQEINNFNIILNNTNKEISKNNYCRDKVSESLNVLRICLDDLDVCDKKRCIRKCCPDGQSFVNGKFCKNTYVRGIDLEFIGNIENPNGSHVLVHGYQGRPTILPRNDKNHKLFKNGTFLENYNNQTQLFLIHDGAYCIEHAVKKTKKLNIDNYALFLILPLEIKAKPIPLKIIINRYLLCISCSFLFLTIAFYTVSKEIEKLFGKTLISLCVALLVTFILLIYLGFHQAPPKKICLILGFILIYFGYCCFTWLNVMCFDIFWTFGSPKQFKGFQKQAQDKKRFFLYCLYGWGFSLLLFLITLLFYFVDVLPETVKIHIGETKCLIENPYGNFADIVFTVIPIFLMEIVNVVLFVKTIMYCLKVKNEINKMNDNNESSTSRKKKFNANKERFLLIIKLFIIMGTSFLFEVVSSFYNFGKNDVTKYIEIIWDILNSLQGVFIFIIFACKRKIIQKCKLRFYKDERRTSLSSGQTQTTSCGNNLKTT
ncbi:unnamed protein product [Brassicogethes aeneus]|uniref:Uncharacterized protein n=1 Tax=Brassicogethes aeneus TaxID=1431903 RepID=A0A9P0B526_BRAAE|nr:unnamed protein product [Brassicogethes aeneus]